MTPRPFSSVLPGLAPAIAGLLIMACGAEEPPPPDVPCAAGEQKLADGRCQPPGLPLDMPCPPGEAPLEDGSCQPAGVPPSECGDGFEADGEGGCKPLLPDEPCPDGLLAVPGEAACHEVAPCGAGTWGDIPVEADTQFVDGSYSGMDSDGTQARPWTTIQEGVDAAAKGAIVAIAAGTYQERVTLSFKARRLWGRCPSMVTIAGDDPTHAAVEVFVSGAEVRGVGITGAGPAVFALNAEPLLLANTWIHDVNSMGIIAHAPSVVTVSGSLVERVVGVGARSEGAGLAVERSAVRDVQPDSGGFSALVDSVPQEGARPSVAVRSSHLERPRFVAVNTVETDLTVEGVAIRPMVPGMAVNGFSGGGVVAAASAVTVRQTTIEGVPLGIVLQGSLDGAVDRVTVADGASPPPGGPWIAGLLVEADPETGAPSSALVQRSAVVRQAQFGVVVLKASAVVESTLVRDNVRGLGHEAGVDAEQAELTIRRSAVLDHVHLGLSLESAAVVLESSVVRGVRPTTDAGDCVAARKVLGLGDSVPPGDLTVRSSVIEDCVETGVAVVESHLAMEDSVVRSVASRPDGLFGDGIAILGIPAGGGAARITGARVEDAARAGISAFGGEVELGFSAVSCAKFDLAGEALGGASFSFDKLGDNACGCPEPTELCKVQSPGIGPPALH